MHVSLLFQKKEKVSKKTLFFCSSENTEHLIKVIEILISTEWNERQPAPGNAFWTFHILSWLVFRMVALDLLWRNISSGRIVIHNVLPCDLWEERLEWYWLWQVLSGFQYLWIFQHLWMILVFDEGCGVRSPFPSTLLLPVA